MSKKSLFILSLAMIFCLSGLIYLGRSRDPSKSLSESTAGESGSNIDPEVVVSNHNYQNQKYGFSLRFPNDISASRFEEDGGETILIKSKKSDFSIQIYVTPFDEDVALDVARIQADIPDLQMENPIEIKTDGIPTVAFFSNDKGARYREIWFVRNGFLYQILAPADNDALTGQIMQTWKWTDVNGVI